MTAVTYIASRSVIGAHTAGLTYSLDLLVLSDTPGNSREVFNTVNESLSKARETIRFGAAKFYDVSLAPLTGSALLAVEEFLHSCESGETFTFDFYGSVAVPLNPIAVDLDKGGYAKNRWQSIGAGGATDYFTLSFRVREIVS